MGVSPGAEVAALVLTVLVHVIGAGILVWAMLSGEEREDGGGWWRGWWPSDDPRPVPEPEGPRGVGVPLPDAEQAGRRFRAPGRLADGYPRPSRRPAHPPAPAPEREPAQRRR